MGSIFGGGVYNKMADEAELGLMNEEPKRRAKLGSTTTGILVAVRALSPILFSPRFSEGSRPNLESSPVLIGASFGFFFKNLIHREHLRVRAREHKFCSSQQAALTSPPTTSREF